MGEMKQMLAAGKLPFTADEKQWAAQPKAKAEAQPWLMGQVAGAIPSLLPARVIVDQMMEEAARVIKANAASVRLPSRL